MLNWASTQELDAKSEQEIPRLLSGGKDSVARGMRLLAVELHVSAVDPDPDRDPDKRLR